MAASITAPSNEKPMFEYLKRSLRASTAPSSTAMRARVAASGNGRTSCQWSPSRPSRTSPPPWASSSRRVTPAIAAPDTDGSHCPTVSSRRSTPRSARRTTAVAVNVFEWEAMRKRWSVVRAVPAVDVGEPVGRLEDDVAVVEHGGLDAGDPIEASPEGQPGVEVRTGVEHGGALEGLSQLVRSLEDSLGSHRPTLGARRQSATQITVALQRTRAPHYRPCPRSGRMGSSGDHP